jgi:tetratricopeptide (TPR) repeat protein
MKSKKKNKQAEVKDNLNKITKKRRKPVLIKGTSIYVYLSLLVILPLILNWKIISYEFTAQDDTVIIANNYNFLSDFRNIFQAFEKDNFISKKGQAYYRPVQTVSFMIDAQINGEKPYTYHFSNILYHILTVIVLFFLLRKLRVRDNISFFLSLLFSVHPLFTDAIVWIPGRGDLLAGLFCSLSFLSFLNYYSTKNKLYFIFHSVAFLLALFSKEMSVFLPVVIIFYYWFVLKNKYKIRMLVPYLVIWSFSVLLFFFLRHIYLNPQNVLSFNAFFTNLPVIPTYLSKLVIPIGLSPMAVIDNLFTVVGLILFILLVIYVVKIKIENKHLILLGIFWFLGFMMPLMFVDLPFARANFEYLECRAYLPSIGIFIALGVLLNEIIKGNGTNILLKYFIPVILIFMVISYTYSGEFADPVIFYSSLIKINPLKAYAFNQRGGIYISQNNFDLAFADFDSAIKVSPAFSEPYFNKGGIYKLTNDDIKAEHFLSLALNYDTLYPETNNLNEIVYINLSTEKLNLKKYDEAITLLRKGIGKYPDNCSLHNNLGLVYYNIAKFDSALFEYDRAIKLEKNEYSYYNNRGMAEYHLNKFTDAVGDFHRVLELKPDFLDAWENMGMAKIKLNDFEGAISDLTKAISIKQDVGAAWYFRGIAFSKLNKIIEAKGDWKKAMELGYPKAAEMIDRYIE